MNFPGRSGHKSEGNVGGGEGRNAESSSSQGAPSFKVFARRGSDKHNVILRLMERLLSEGNDLKDIKGLLENSLKDVEKEIELMTKMTLLSSEAMLYQNCVEQFSSPSGANSDPESRAAAESASIKVDQMELEH